MAVSVSETPTTVTVDEVTNVVQVSTVGIPLLPPGGTVGQIAVRTDTGHAWYDLVNTDPVQPAQGEFPGQMWAPPA